MKHVPVKTAPHSVVVVAAVAATKAAAAAVVAKAAAAAAVVGWGRPAAGREAACRLQLAAGLWAGPRQPWGPVSCERHVSKLQGGLGRRHATVAGQRLSEDLDMPRNERRLIRWRPCSGWTTARGLLTAHRAWHCTIVSILGSPRHAAPSRAGPPLRQRALYPTPARLRCCIVAAGRLQHSGAAPARSSSKGSARPSSSQYGACSPGPGPGAAGRPGSGSAEQQAARRQRR